jgi:hypothetical protein
MRGIEQRNSARRSARMCPPNAMAATSAASASCWTSRNEGKKRMREYGSVSNPQEAFIAALRMGEE